jgi:hypothetical protein
MWMIDEEEDQNPECHEDSKTCCNISFFLVGYRQRLPRWGEGARRRARLPDHSGEDDVDMGTAAVAGNRKSMLLDEVSQLNPDRAPITLLGLNDREYAFRLLLMGVPTSVISPSVRKHMPVASEMTLSHSTTSSCWDVSDNSSNI